MEHPLFTDLFDRLADMHDDIKEAIAGLSSDALDWVPGPDMNSLTVLVTHTCGAERYWIGHMAGGQNTDRVRAEEFKTTGGDEAALVGLLDATLADSQQVLSRLTVDDLSVPRTHERREFRAAWSLFHALEHTSVHVGHIQMIRQLWDQRQ